MPQGRAQQPEAQSLAPRHWPPMNYRPTPLPTFLSPAGSNLGPPTQTLAVSTSPSPSAGGTPQPMAEKASARPMTAAPRCEIREEVLFERIDIGVGSCDVSVRGSCFPTFARSAPTRLSAESLRADGEFGKICPSTVSARGLRVPLETALARVRSIEHRREMGMRRRRRSVSAAIPRRELELADNWRRERGSGGGGGGGGGGVDQKR